MAYLISGTTVINNSGNLENLTNIRTAKNTSLLGTGNITSGNMTSLGSITTTSGSTLSLTGLTLTNYSYLYLRAIAVSLSASDGELYLSDGTTTVYWGDLDPGGGGIATNVIYGMAWIDLTTGEVKTKAGTGAVGHYASYTSGGFSYYGRTRYTTSSTSVTVFSFSTFDAGSIQVFGVE